MAHPQRPLFDLGGESGRINTITNKWNINDCIFRSGDGGRLSQSINYVDCNSVLSVYFLYASFAPTIEATKCSIGSGGQMYVFLFLFPIFFRAYLRVTSVELLNFFCMWKYTEELLCSRSNLRFLAKWKETICFISHCQLILNLSNVCCSEHKRLIGPCHNANIVALCDSGLAWPTDSLSV